MQIDKKSKKKLLKFLRALAINKVQASQTANTRHKT